MTWLPLVVALVALIGVILTNVVAWRNNRALDAKWRAELAASETRWRTELAASEDRAKNALESAERQDKRAKAIDVYKWASELAVSDNPSKAQTGVDALKGLLMGNLLDEDMKPLVVATLSSSFAAELRAIETGGEDVEVVQLILEPPQASSVGLAPDAEPDPQPEAGDADE